MGRQHALVRFNHHWTCYLLLVQRLALGCRRVAGVAAAACFDPTAWPLIGKCRWCRAAPVPACRLVLHRLPMAWCSQACATSLFPTRLRQTACITCRTRRRRSPASSAATILLKYGLTIHDVLRVRIVTIDGDIVELDGEALDALGLNLLAVFHRLKGHARRSHRNDG